MGNSESKAKSTTEIKNKVLNQSTINSYNETINESMTKSVTDIAQVCGASASIEQVVTMRDIEILNSKGVTLDFSQSATVSFKFSCEQVANIINTVQDEMIDTIVNQIETSADAGLMNDIKESMAANAETQPLAFGGSSSSTDSATSVNNEIINKTDVNIRNVTKNIVSNEFESKIRSNCIAQATAFQSGDMSGLKIRNAEDITVNFAQTAVITMVADCVQEASVGNEAIKKLAKLANFEIIDDKSASSDNKSDKDNTSSAKATGLMESLGGLKGTKFMAIIPIVSSSLSAVLSLAGLALGFVMMGGLDEIPM